MAKQTGKGNASRTHPRTRGSKSRQAQIDAQINRAMAVTLDLLAGQDLRVVSMRVQGAVERVSVPFDVEGGPSALRKLGITSLGTDAEDPRLQRVQLPTGWRIERANHPHWIDVIDDQDRVRLWYSLPGALSQPCSARIVPI